MLRHLFEYKPTFSSPALAQIHCMDTRLAFVVAAVALCMCFAIEARRQDIVLGSTTFSLTDRVLKCMEILGFGVTNGTDIPGGDMKRCLREMRTTTRAPNETYFNNIEQELLVAEEGSSALLECQIINLGRKHVSWIRQGEALSHMQTMYTADRRFKMESVNSTFNIRIAGVEKSDAGKYRCRVLAKRSTINMIERIVELEVPSLPNIVSMEPTSAPFFSPSDPDRRYFNLTSDVTLYCNATGSPEPDVSWERVRDPLGRDPIGGSSPAWGDTVLLPNITERDTGIYNCTASNGVGNVERSLEIVVQYKPIVRSPDTSIRAGRGEYVTLSCEVRAVPRAEIVWRTDKMAPLNGGQGSDRDGRQGSTYIIVRVDPNKDYANYTCVATNLIGTKQVSIEVHGRPIAPTVTSTPMSGRRHAYSLSWRPGVPSEGKRPQEIPISSYVILFRGWWIEKNGALQRVVYTHEKPLREVVQARDDRRTYDYIIRDLRPNTTYEMVIYGRNQYGNGEQSSFTFYTANENAPSTPRLPTSTDTTTPAQRITPGALKSGAMSTGRAPFTISALIATFAIITFKVCSLN